MKTLLQSYVEQEIWLLIRDKWYFARVLEVGEDLLRFHHRTYNKDAEEDTLWEMVVKQSEIIALDRVKTVISRKPNVLISQLQQTDPATNHEEQEK